MTLTWLTSAAVGSPVAGSSRWWASVPSARTQRRLRAEEAAAKLPVKLLIPLIFCVFPSLLTVLLGPVVVTLARQLIKTPV